MEYVFGLVICGVLLWLVLNALSVSTEKKLDTDIQEAWNNARIFLSTDDLARLKYQLAEIEVIVDAQILSGQINYSQAALARKEATLRSIKAFLEFGKMFPLKTT